MHSDMSWLVVPGGGLSVDLLAAEVVTWQTEVAASSPSPPHRQLPVPPLGFGRSYRVSPNDGSRRTSALRTTVRAA